MTDAPQLTRGRAVEAGCRSDQRIAAAAADRGFGVLHYDAHFDRLAEALPFISQWIAPRGSIS